MSIIIAFTIMLVAAIIICFRNVVNSKDTIEAYISSGVGIILTCALIMFADIVINMEQAGIFNG